MKIGSLILLTGEQILNDELIFDYKLKDGRLKSRNAIKILELYNFPSEIIKDARATENQLFRKHNWINDLFDD